MIYEATWWWYVEAVVHAWAGWVLGRVIVAGTWAGILVALEYRRQQRPPFDWEAEGLYA